MRKIQLTQGKVALVDDEDHDWLSQRKWYAQAYRRRDGSIKVWYALHNGPVENGKHHHCRVYMHREILVYHGLLDNDDKRQGDHEDHDGLNNQLENLRVSTRKQNQYNRQKQSKTSSQYKGVTWSKTAKKWQAQIQIDGKNHYLGYYEIEIEAALAYNTAACKAFGEFACLNLVKSV